MARQKRVPLARGQQQQQQAIRRRRSGSRIRGRSVDDDGELQQLRLPPLPQAGSFAGGRPLRREEAAESPWQRRRQRAVAGRPTGNAAIDRRRSRLHYGPPQKLKTVHSPQAPSLQTIVSLRSTDGGWARARVPGGCSISLLSPGWGGGLDVRGGCSRGHNQSSSSRGVVASLWQVLGEWVNGAFVKRMMAMARLAACPRSGPGVVVGGAGEASRLVVYHPSWWPPHAQRLLLTPLRLLAPTPVPKQAARQPTPQPSRLLPLLP